MIDVSQTFIDFAPQIMGAQTCMKLTTQSVIKGKFFGKFIVQISAVLCVAGLRFAYDMAWKIKHSNVGRNRDLFAQASLSATCLRSKLRKVAHVFRAWHSSSLWNDVADDTADKISLLKQYLLVLYKNWRFAIKCGIMFEEDFLLLLKIK